MKNQAFTLIELLVVVLIIGILAAIAVPQYQKAVYKSHAAEAMSMLKAIEEAQSVYYLAHSEYTNNINDLDINVPTSFLYTGVEEKPINGYIYYCPNLYECIATNANPSMPYFEYHHKNNSGDVMAGKFYCHLGSGNNKNDTAKSICQSMGTLDNESSDEAWFKGKYFIIN